MTRQISLSVNEVPISLDYFVQGFIDHTVSGMLAALEGTGEMERLELTIDKGQVTINLNDAPVPINSFVNKTIGNTITGMLSSLKGVGQIDRVKLNITK